MVGGMIVDTSTFKDRLYRTFNRFGIASCTISYTFYGTGCQALVKPGYNTITIDGLTTMFNHVSSYSQKIDICSNLPLGIHTVTITT